MHHRNVNDRRETIKNIKRLIRRKEKDNEQLDADLEELALSVAERRNVNEANGQWNRLYLPVTLFFFSLLVILPQKGNEKRKFYATVLHARTGKNMDRKRRNKTTALSDPKFDFFPVFLRLDFSSSKVLALYTLTSVCIFSTLFSIHCLRC